MQRTVTIRARAETRDALNELAAAVGKTVPELLDELATRERDRRLLHDGLAALGAMDMQTSTAYLGELAEWDDAPLQEPAA